MANDAGSILPSCSAAIHGAGVEQGGRTNLKLLALGALLLGASIDQAAACAAPESRQFDFWLGDWQVHRADGSFAGINRITLEYDGCVIHEHYATGKGYSGESLNTYDAARKVWHQTWVDDSGLLLVLEGRWDGTSMVLEGSGGGADSASSRQRITWTPNHDGSVRQLWQSMDGRGGWVVVFDGRYTKH